jgi:hypothetical protein
MKYLPSKKAQVENERYKILYNFLEGTSLRLFGKIMPS